MSAKITVYMTTITSTVEVKKHQQYIMDILSGQKIDFETVDISSETDAKDKMRSFSGPTSLPPQIVNGDQYCGGYDEFFLAVEDKEVEKFLKL